MKISRLIKILRTIQKANPEALVYIDLGKHTRELLFAVHCCDRVELVPEDSE